MDHTVLQIKAQKAFSNLFVKKQEDLLKPQVYIFGNKVYLNLNVGKYKNLKLLPFLNIKAFFDNEDQYNKAQLL